MLHASTENLHGFLEMECAFTKSLSHCKCETLLLMALRCFKRVSADNKKLQLVLAMIIMFNAFFHKHDYFEFHTLTLITIYTNIHICIL